MKSQIKKPLARGLINTDSIANFKTTLTFLIGECFCIGGIQ